ncbi:hypothetical protein [Bradyrhizobium sp. AUGA SZCCT0182]|uniref:hypothetical protein n=1 Tax=Bradyrhizobium sp. AUGA SZCCT0182 TaxID=2807667 RepID=UPI001BAB551B|nr:hypothetical protein [Bradyrhizobium sp. AUGA SZCCT0182]MBR1232021.1 hypothetical protein [Bradyrhizobium sp. AUGA SZCCT0182]
MPLPVLVVALMASSASATNLQIKKNPNGYSTYRKGVYCGPGWGFTYQDLLDGKIKQMPKAIDAIDEACRLHDTCYQENGYVTQGCNLVLSADLAKVVIDPKSTPEQRVDAAIMAAIFFLESQSIDLATEGGRKAIKGAQWTRRKYDQVRDRMLGYMGQSMHTLEQAILREMMNH